MVEMLHCKKVSQDSEAVKEGGRQFNRELTESDFNLARGCQDLGAAAEDDDANSGDIDLVRGGQDTNAIMTETMLTK